MSYGKADSLDLKLKAEGNNEILARHHGGEKTGVAFKYMPIVADDCIVRLDTFPNFTAGNDGDANLANYWLKYNEDGSVDDLKNEWAPKKYDCLAYVNWDISPEDKVGEATAVGGGGRPHPSARPRTWRQRPRRRKPDLGSLPQTPFLLSKVLHESGGAGGSDRRKFKG